MFKFVLALVSVGFSLSSFAETPPCSKVMEQMEFNWGVPDSVFPLASKDNLSMAFRYIEDNRLVVIATFDALSVFDIDEKLFKTLPKCTTDGEEFGVILINKKAPPAIL